MNIKTIGIFAVCALLAVSPAVRAGDDDVQYDADVVEYQDYDADSAVFDDVQDLIDEELVESVDVVDVDPEPLPVVAEPEPENVVVEVPVPRAVADRLSCDEINTRVTELRADAKAYPELKADLEYMLSRQRNQCAPRATRRPVHNYNNVNPVTDVEIPTVEVVVTNEPVEPEKTPEEIAAEEAAAEAARQAEIEENRAKDLCDDGTKPNKYGCCAGEVFKQVEHLNFACCPKDGDGDCREPRKK